MSNQNSIDAAYTGKRIEVVYVGDIYTTYKHAAELLGYPDAVVSEEVDKHNILGSIKKGTTGTVLAEAVIRDDKILAVQGDNGLRFLIGFGGVRIIENPLKN